MIAKRLFKKHRSLKEVSDMLEINPSTIAYWQKTGMWGECAKKGTNKPRYQLKNEKICICCGVSPVPNSKRYYWLCKDCHAGKGPGSINDDVQNEYNVVLT